MTSDPKWINDWLIVEQLGHGTYSKVFKVLKKGESEHMALGQINITQFENKEKDNILTEIRILSSIKHPNIINYHESLVDFSSNTLCIITEYADYGDLSDCIQRFKNLKKQISERDIWVIVFQILWGIKALHNASIIHRDLKSANIFLFSDGSVKIGDMNVATIIKNQEKFATTQTGTPYYSSPEVWGDTPYSFKSDLWSLGCMVYEMASQKVPFDADNPYQLMKKITEGVYDTLPKIFSVEVENLVTMLLNVDPTQRPTCDELLTMPFVQKIEKYLRENYILKASRVSGNTKGPVDFGKTIKFESLEILNEELKNKNCERRGGKVRDQTPR
jgi:NIMA (never in mitosis gene a)-related kinase